MTASQPAPNEAEIQIYVNSGKTFIELESQGAYDELKPGESLSYTVRWYLVPVNSESIPSKSCCQKSGSLSDNLNNMLKIGEWQFTHQEIHKNLSREY